MLTWNRAFADDSGQDVIEYALLTSVFAFGAIAGMLALGQAMNTTYSAFDTGFQGDAYVEVPEPLEAP